MSFSTRNYGESTNAELERITHLGVLVLGECLILALQLRRNHIALLLSPIFDELARG